MAIDVNGFATLFVKKKNTTFCPVTTNSVEANHVVPLFVVTGQNVVITTNRVTTINLIELLQYGKTTTAELLRCGVLPVVAATCND